jgi:uncharacterized repeat protein (TIGR01451 family)
MMTQLLRATQRVLSRLPAVAVLLGLAAGSAGAQATITVNSTLQVVAPTAPSGNNDGMCSLSEAIVAANTNSAVDACTAGQSGGTDTIMLPAGTYTLSQVDNTADGPSGLPFVNFPILIQGAGAATTILERSTAGGTPAMRAFIFQDTLTINNLTVRNFAGANGAVALGRGGQFITNDCVLTGNDAGAAGQSVYNTNFGTPATFNNTVITNNTSTSGGAIRGIFGRLTFNNTLVANNTGIQPVISSDAAGGVPPTLSITDSTISNNTSTTSGVRISGGFSAGTLTVTRSVFSGNSSGGSGGSGGGLLIMGTFNGGTGVINASITDSVFSGNTQRSDNGGGIAVLGPGNVTITGSQITGNSLLSSNLASGGGIHVGGIGPMTIRNSTISGNSSVGRGGGVGTNFGVPSDSLTLNNVTITNNSAAIRGGGLDQSGSLGTITLSNTVLAGNSSAGSNPDCASDAASLVSLGFNLLGENTGCTLTAASGDVVGTGAAPINPLLQALADNGSTVMAGANIPGFASPMVVRTHALFTGSPALNTGNTATPLDGASGRCEATDQRGLPRPGGAACDMGAFEDQTGNGIPVTADLSVTKSGNPASVTVGQNVTFTLTVTNNGPDPAAATLNDVLPASFNFVSLAAPAGWMCTTPAAGATGTVNCTNTGLSSGASDVFTLIITATAAGIIGNTTSVSTGANDPVAGNNSATANTTVTSPEADVAVTKMDSPDPINLGQGNITYTLVVTNNGPGSASNVMLTDTLPMGVTFVSVMPAAPICAQAAGVVTCNVGNLAAMGSMTITIIVTPTAAGTLTNNASVTATETDPTPANNMVSAQTTVNPSADLSVTKTDSPDPVIVNNNLTYTLTVNNSGPSAATTVSLTDTLPANTTFQSITPAMGWNCVTPAVGAGGTVTCAIANFASGAAAAIFTLVVRPTAAGMLSNTATIGSAVFDPSNANNSNTAMTTVNPAPPDFSVSVSPTTATVDSGQAAMATVTVTPNPAPFASAVTLDCTNPPHPLLVCSFNPASGTPNSTPLLSQLAVATQMAPAASPITTWRILPPTGVWFPLLALCLALLALRGEGRVRRLRFALVVLLLLVTLLPQAACNGDGLARVPAGNYPITIRATSGNLTHTTSLTLTVR